MLVLISWFASRGPLGSSFEASWGLFRALLWPLLGLFGASWGLLGPSWGSLGASWGPLGAFWGPLGADSLNFRFVVPLFGPSWGRLGALLGRLGRLLGRLGAFFGRLGGLLGASWAVLGRCSRLLGQSWSVGSSTRREREKHRKTHRKSLILASWGPLGGPLGMPLGPLGGLLGGLERSWAVLAAACRPRKPRWTPRVAEKTAGIPEEGPLSPGAQVGTRGGEIREGVPARGPGPRYSAI